MSSDILLRLGLALGETLRKRNGWAWHAKPEIPGVLGPNGQGLDFLERSSANGPRMRQLYTELAADFNDGGVQSGALRRIVSHNRRSGASTIFVGMPGAREYIEDMHEGGRTAWRAQWTRLRALAEDTGCPLIDVSDEFEDPVYYADMLHLNRRGRDEYSAAVAERLASHLTTAGKGRTAQGQGARA